jgi:curved DNA-binding protein CbpA
MANLYSILELPVFSDISEVKKNFKRLALKYHPDVNKHDPRTEERFKKLNHAYQILSDERKKRRYDEILKYQLNRPVQKPKTTFTGSTQYRRSGPLRKPPKKKARRYYNVVTLAFFGLGLILFQIISELNESRLEKNLIESIQERKELMEKSRAAFKRGEMRNAMELLNAIQFNTTGKDFLDLKYNIFHYSDSLSEELITQRRYDSALYHLEFLLDYKTKVDAGVYTRMSECYRNLGKIESAIKLLQGLLISNPNHLVAHKELAHIYQYDLGDFDLSLSHYETATKIIVKNYVDFYGKAYIAIINPANHPKSDQLVFLEKAKIYYNYDQIDSSLVASRWASFLNPDNSEAYLIQGLCWLKKGESEKACEVFRKAKNTSMILPAIDSLSRISC